MNMGFAEHYATPVGARLGTNIPRTDALKDSVNSRNAFVFSVTNRQVAEPCLAAAICGADASSGRADRSGRIPRHLWREHCEGYLQHPMKQRTRITVRVATERQSNPWLA